MVVAFARTFLLAGIKPESVTILSAYKEQMIYIREQLAVQKTPIVVHGATGGTGITVLTIDQVWNLLTWSLCSALGSLLYLYFFRIGWQPVVNVDAAARSIKDQRTSLS